MNVRDAQLQFLARTLLVGMLSGAVLGALTATLLALPSLAWVSFAWMPGAMVGLVLGAATSLLGAVLVLALRREQSARPILAATATLVAAVTVWWLISWFDAGWTPTALATMLAGIAAGLMAWSIAPWCLAPLSAPLPTSDPMA